jgi:alpha-methylacyl-CoA racemase
MFATRTREEWCELLEGTDVCFAPVLSLEEAPHHPHNVARGVFLHNDGIVQPAPAPRFATTPSELRRAPPNPGANTQECLEEWGVSLAAISQLRDSGAIGADVLGVPEENPDQHCPT